MNFSILLKTSLTILTTKLPVWVVLLIIGLVAVVLTRPDLPLPTGAIEYRTYWKPPIVKRPLPPVGLVQYTPVPRSELRVDTIFVPVAMTDYQLWKPEQVQQRSGSVVIRSFDVGSLTYRDYSFKPLETKYDANFGVSLLINPVTYQMQTELDGIFRYKRLGLVGRVGVVGSEPYALVGLRWELK
jgi:hypothetical protein